MSKEKKEIAVREKEEISKSSGEPTQSGVLYSPAVDIYETEQAITLLADLPGVGKDELDIKVEDRQLILTGLVKASDSAHKTLYREYRVGGYTRTFQLGDTIDQSKIDASLKNGVLTLVLPKAEHLKPRKIQVTAA